MVMGAGAVESMVNTIPVVVTGGIALKFADAALPKTTGKGLFPKAKSKTRKKAKRSKSKKSRK